MARGFTGQCHICGNHGKLSYEHVPPRAAFNERPLVAKTVDQILKTTDESAVKGKIFQRGAGAHTLCPKCNSDTGSWYGKNYVDWVYQGMHLIYAAHKSPSLYYNYHILPLRVIKQIICMFLSINGIGFRDAHPYLVNFVLNRELRHLPDDIRIFAFYAIGTSMRQTGISALLDLNEPGVHRTFSELVFPPFGYVMTFDNPPKGPLVDISYFARYSYNDFRSMPLQFSVLSAVSYLPGDYRTQEEIDEHLRKQSEEK